MATTTDERRASPRGRRMLYSLTGAALAFYGLRRRSLPGALLAIAGGNVMVRAWSGEGVGRLRSREQARTFYLERAVTVRAPAGELYRRFRDVEALPRLLRHLEDVKDLGQGRARFRAMLLSSRSRLEWDAQIVEDEEGRVLSWRSLPDAPVEASATVRFEEGPRGTIVRLSLSYQLPDRRAGALFGRALSPALAEGVKEDLRRLKAEMEAGEVPTIHGQPAGAGRPAGLSLFDRAGGKA